MTEPMIASPSLRGRDMRVGDAERAALADRLAAHAAAGRLSVDELEQRLAAAHAAVYARELARLEADLPDLVARRARRHGPGPPWPARPIWIVALLVVSLLASVAAGHPVGLPLLVAFFVWRSAGWRRPRRLATGRSVS